MNKFEKGSIVTGKVTGIESYGIFVGIDENYNGLIHISEISDGFVRDINNYAMIGEKIKARIVDEDESENHLKLSIKGINYRNGKRKKNTIQEYGEGFKPLKDNLDRWIKEYEDK